MSYNIDTWRTKVLEDFRIPLSVIKDSTLDNEYITIELKKNKVYVEGGSEALEMICHQDGDDLVIESVTSYGDGSGYFHIDFFKKWLAKSKGKLEAVLVWEGGDSITRLIANNGEVTETEIDL